MRGKLKYIIMIAVVMTSMCLCRREVWEKTKLDKDCSDRGK